MAENPGGVGCRPTDFSVLHQQGQCGPGNFTHVMSRGPPEDCIGVMLVTVYLPFSVRVVGATALYIPGLESISIF